MGPMVMFYPKVFPTKIIGMILFLFTEVMFFGGLISAFLVLRGQSLLWPPLDQPRLPIEITGLNTAILLVSGFSIGKAWRDLRLGRWDSFRKCLFLTWILGSIFLTIQGMEWLRLLTYGLTTSSSLYGGTFYLLIGIHALHVFSAVVVLWVVGWKARHGIYTSTQHSGVTLAMMYWLFVVGIWPLLYALVYF